MSRFLLLPCNNTLSHITKALAVRKSLEERGHQVWMGISPSRVNFLRRIGEDRAILELPDLQEADAAATPGFAWFRPSRVKAVVKAETEALLHLAPDRVLGIFRFSAPLSAHLAKVPCDSLICGSMTPACEEVLGFDSREPGAEQQAMALDFFRRAGARRMTPALNELGLPLVDDLWRLLEGQQTLLWDFPEFQPLPAQHGYLHAGPPDWHGWPYADVSRLDQLQGPIAFVAFGTGHAPAPILTAVLDALWQLGFAVALAMGGGPIHGLQDVPGRLAVFDFLSAEKALERAQLVVCHGGQLLIFEAMRRRLPVFVLPMQPEQAQNGRCLERLGCGLRLQDGHVFNHQLSTDAPPLPSPRFLAERIANFLDQPDLAMNLIHGSRMLARYPGVEALADALESAL